MHEATRVCTQNGTRCTACLLHRYKSSHLRRERRLWRKGADRQEKTTDQHMNLWPATVRQRRDSYIEHTVCTCCVIIYANSSALFTHTINTWQSMSINTTVDAGKCVQWPLNNWFSDLNGSFLRRSRTQLDSCAYNNVHKNQSTHRMCVCTCSRYSS